MIGVKVVCDTCGNAMPEDAEKTTKEFKAYLTQCTCGGKALIQYGEDQVDIVQKTADEYGQAKSDSIDENAREVLISGTMSKDSTPAKKKRKPAKRKPTIRQKRVVKKVVEMVENGGSVSVSKAMREAGYSEATASNPKKVTSTKTWQDLMNEYLPDEDLQQHHKQLLNLGRIEHMVMSSSLTKDEARALIEDVHGCTVKKMREINGQLHVWFLAPDATAKKSALELAYKIKGKFAPSEVNVTVKSKLDNLTDEELEAIATGERTLEDTT